jgi:hypothetical protein
MVTRRVTEGQISARPAIGRPQPAHGGKSSLRASSLRRQRIALMTL